MMRAWLLALLALFIFFAPASAHEIRPAFLELRETAPMAFEVSWRVPAKGDMRLALQAVLPEICSKPEPASRSMEGAFYYERWRTACSGDISGKPISILGLQTSVSEVLIRIGYLGRPVETARLTAANPTYHVRGPGSMLETGRTYFLLGVEHILAGIDHLLFVLALLLLISDWRKLVQTITAFTIAHSITLTGASLGYFSLPQRPVEAAIALSILFLALEVIKRGGATKRLSEQWPWGIAFLFGLLHGLGFAGALEEIGLPQGEVPLALLSFNLGVEFGQLLFVGAWLVVMALVTRFVRFSMRPLHVAVAYMTGIASTVWFLQRLVLVLA